MIRDWLSRYNLRYPRIIVYMLQASEYNIRDYVAWYHTTKNFTYIEKRKQFVGTVKAFLLLVITWVFVFLSFATALYLILTISSPLSYIGSFLIVVLLPDLLAYGILIPLLLVNLFLQTPIEFFILRKTKRNLEKHNAIKIGIAGSFGKTTMREILKTVLAEGRTVDAPPGSHNTPLGISQFVNTLTGKEEVLVFELGEYYSGDIEKLCNLVGPSIGIITGINEAHLQRFKTLEQTVKAIYELADYLGDKIVYVNGESALAKQSARPGHVLYGLSGIRNWNVENAKTDLNGTSFTLVKNGVKLKLHSMLLGLHQIGPLAVAVDVAMSLGLSIEQIKSGIAKTKPFKHRLESKTDSGGVTLIDDSYNGNPDGVEMAIGFLNSLENCRRFYVTPGLVEMGDKTQEVHIEIGRKLAQTDIEKIVLIKNSVTSYIKEGLEKNAYKGEVIWFDNALSAFAALPHMTVKGDVVLLQNDWSDQYK